jgi:hypothetical protein
VTPPDFHFVLLNPGVALPLGGVKASASIHSHAIEACLTDPAAAASDRIVAG